VRRWAAVAVVLALAVPVAAQPIDPYGEEPAKPEKKPAKKKKAPEPKKEPAPTPEDKKPAVEDPYADVGLPATPTPAPTTGTRGLDVEAIQGLLAVQSLDAWLLYDRAGQNPIAEQVVKPAGSPARAWFYLIPVKGDPTVLCHQSETQAFDALPGKKLTYASYRELSKQLKTLLKGKKSVAMEYSPKAAVPSVSRVDAGTIELVKGLGVNVKSSAGLVQFTKAVWGPEGRKRHYIAVHHLTELRKDALAWLAKRIGEGKPVTELDVQRRLVEAMKMRGLEGPAPVVAAGPHTADPFYVPTEQSSAAIGIGDLVVISLAGKTENGIYAATTWVAYVGDRAPERMASAFEAVSLARDEAIALITDRVKRRRAVKGSEVDAAARGFLNKANLADKFVHRTGHAIDTDLQGAAADLDDYEIKDARPLVVGSGFTIGPGVYFPGEFGVRAEVSAYLGPRGLEVTTPKQESIEALLAK
jgi:Xaa-Pro dipeptidase